MHGDDTDQDRPSGDITLLLDEAREGGSEALEALVMRVYRELRRTAANMVRRERRPAFSLMATDVVHEAFFRLFGDAKLDWQDRRHFFGSAAIAMRRVLIEHARRKHAGKRIPDRAKVTLGSADEAVQLPDLDLLALDRALARLEARNPRQARVVELRFFVGLSVAEIAEILEVSAMTVKRDWGVARLRLLRDLQG
ncbi:MAG: ECF-type sigma factor [Holophagales bacterium]|nr:ECF-type sigma factor [Holophagales bacterium]